MHQRLEESLKSIHHKLNTVGKESMMASHYFLLVEELGADACFLKNLCLLKNHINDLLEPYS